MKLNTPHGHRQLSFPLVYNARDLGGLHNAHGQETRWKSFVRCDSPFRLNDEGLRLVHDYGIRTVIDLRHDEELAREPNPLREHTGIHYVNVPFINPRNLSVLVNTIETEGMLAWNLKMLEVARPEISAAFRAIANAPEGGVLFHCYAGKDRTGLTALLVLNLAGVPDEDIALDYDESNHHLTPLNEQVLVRFPAEVRPRVLRNLLSGKDNMLKITAHLREHYIDAAAYLHQGGLKAEEIDAIKSRLI